jgi:hypothetical protein
MAKNTQLSNAAVNAEADALARLLDGGFCDIYDGTQPATADTAISTQTKLASLGLNATSAPSASAGVLTFNSITADTDADATGTAAWARCFKSDHTTAVMDVSVGTSSANIVLNSTAIQIHAQVSISSFTHTVAKSTSGL